jgi:riboflavin kinase/FMN adenylyltransferase
MRVARGLDHLAPSADPSFVVVGVFDGLHLGHAYLLEHLVAEARRRDARPRVIPFAHHPDEILIGAAPPLLCDPAERLQRLEAAGVGAIVVVHFDQRLRETTYDAFVEMIAARGPIAGFLMTPDAAFGYRRGGTPATLAELGRTAGFEVVVVPPFELEGHAVRSTEVRAAITTGDLALAGRLLGRAHAVVGEAATAAETAAETAVEAGEGTRLRFALPVALPPDGTYDALVGRVSRHGTGAPVEKRLAVVDRGEGGIPGEAVHGSTRGVVLARSGAPGPIDAAVRAD